MADEQKKRNSYADLGLMIAVTILIVMIIRCLIFGILWEDAFWIIFAGLYCFVSYKYNSNNKILKHATTAFLILAVVSAVVIVYVDRKPQPTMHAFEGAKNDTIEKEEFKPKEDLKVDTDTVKAIEVTDSIDAENDSLVGNAEEGSSESKVNASEADQSGQVEQGE